MLAFVTPDDGGGVYLCRRLYFRAELAPIITGLLISITNPASYEEVGNLSAEEMAGFALDALNDYLKKGGCLIGTTCTYITSEPPSGVLPLDGTTYDGVDYPELYSVLDDAFKNGDGSFTLPDARGRTIVGTGSGSGLSSYLLGDTVGEEEHVLSVEELAEHSHSYDKIVATLADPGEEPTIIAIEDINSEQTGLTGNGTAHENRQPSLALHIGVWYR